VFNNRQEGFLCYDLYGNTRAIPSFIERKRLKEVEEQLQKFENGSSGISSAVSFLPE
jgi:hypothetical protein